MPADKMVSYPMQNNGSLDEETFFFCTRFRTLRCARLCPLETHKLLCTKSQLKLGFNYKKLLFCAVGGLILYFLRKYKERVC